MTTFTERLDAATDTRDPKEYVSRVKAVVRAEIESADRSIKLVDTGYYANSAIPDFEATWATSKATRPVFLRDGLADVVAAHDTSYLPSKDPAILTLDRREVDAELVAEAETQSAAKPDALIATGTSFNSSVLSKAEASPLAQLVRTNFVRGARGLITPLTLDEFVAPEDTESPTDEYATRQMDVIASHFDAKIAYRIKVLSDLLKLAQLSAEEFAAAEGDTNLIADVLSAEELEWVLPALLKSKSRPSTEFWGRFGKLFDLRDLERLSVPFKGLDLTDLVEANKESWSARRAYSGLWLEDGGDSSESLTEEAANPSPSTDEKWLFVGTVLSKHLPESARRIAIVSDGTKLKRSPGATSKSWDQAKELIKERNLLQVDLKGIQRSVSVNAVQSTDIRADVTDVTTSVEDQYLVSSVTLGLKSPEDEVVRADVDFGGSMITASGDVRFSELVEATTVIFESRVADASVEAIESAATDT